MEVAQTDITESTPQAEITAPETKPAGVVEHNGRKFEVTHNGKPYEPKAIATPEAPKADQPVNGEQEKQIPSDPKPVKQKGQSNKDYDWATQTWKRREAERKAQATEAKYAALEKQMQELQKKLEAPAQKVDASNFKTPEDHVNYMVKQELEKQKNEAHLQSLQHQQLEAQNAEIAQTWNNNVGQWFKGEELNSYIEKQNTVAPYIEATPAAVQNYILHSPYGAKIIEAFHDFPHELDNFLKMDELGQRLKLRTVEQAIANHLLKSDGAQAQKQTPMAPIPSPTGKVGSIGSPNTSHGQSIEDKLEAARKKLRG